MNEHKARVYLGTIYENTSKDGQHTWLQGNLGASKLSIWPAKTTTDNGGRKFNMYLEEREDGRQNGASPAPRTKLNDF